MQNNSIICTSEKAVFNRIKLWGASSCKEKISGGTGHNELKFQPHIRSTNADIVLVRPSLPSLWSKFAKKTLRTVYEDMIIQETHFKSLYNLKVSVFNIKTSKP